MTFSDVSFCFIVSLCHLISFSRKLFHLRHCARLCHMYMLVSKSHEVVLFKDDLFRCMKMQLSVAGLDLDAGVDLWEIDGQTSA